MFDHLLWNIPYVSTPLRVLFYMVRGLIILVLMPFAYLYSLGY